MTDTDPTAGNPSPGEGETPTPEGQPATDAATPENDGQPEGDGKQGDTPEGAPESYEAFTLPEGVTLEGERLELANTTFKDLNLNQQQAQGLIDLYTRLQGEDTGALTAAIEAQKLQQIETWGQQAKQALGDKYDETVNLARTAVQHINDPDLGAAFNEMGWGNHPALIRAFAKFGELARDSKVDGLGGGTNTASQQSEGERAYQYAEKPQRRNG